MSATSPDSKALDIGQLLDGAQWSAFQKSVVALVALALVFDGLDAQVLGLAIPALILDWNVARADFAPIAAVGLIGMSIGTVLGGYVGDRIGRKWGLIFSVLVFGVATTASAIVDTLWALGLCRAIVGIGLGGALPNSTAMIAEYTPARSRSVGIAVGMVTIPVGSMLGSLLAAAIIEDLGWRMLFAIGGVPPILLALSFIWLMPESPRYLAGRPQRRAELMRTLARSGVQTASDVQFSGAHSDGRGRTSLSTLFGPGIRKDTMLTWLSFFMTMLALYTLVSWGPAMLAGEGFPLGFTGTALASFGFGGIFGCLCSGWMLKYLGSRITKFLLAGGGALFAVGTGALFGESAPAQTTIMLTFGALGFSLAGMQNALYTLSAHLYATTARATGIGAALSVGRLGAVVSSFTGAWSIDLGGGATFFWVIAAGLGLAAIAGASVERPIPAVRALPG
ncbi:MAG: MFS transporter [Gammaproteobacteria bacterium]